MQTEKRNDCEDVKKNSHFGWPGAEYAVVQVLNGFRSVLLCVDVRVEEDLVRDGFNLRGVEELLHLVDIKITYADAPA